MKIFCLNIISFQNAIGAEMYKYFDSTLSHFELQWGRKREKIGSRRRREKTLTKIAEKKNRRGSTTQKTRENHGRGKYIM
jgi:flagellar biosynthesis chaperone FliJ